MDKATFKPIPVTYSELYLSLRFKGLVVPRPMAPSSKPYPQRYNPNAPYLFHEGSPGHDLESYVTLKRRMQELVYIKVMTFRDVWLNVKNNPLPGHGE